jgi:hypothetical protein
MNKLKRIPVAIIWSICTALAFTFVNYEWIMNPLGRAMYVTLAGLGAVIITICNSELKFWYPKK